MSLYAHGEQSSDTERCTSHVHVVMREEVDRVKVLDVGRDDARDVAPRRARVAGHAPRVAL